MTAAQNEGPPLNVDRPWTSSILPPQAVHREAAGRLLDLPVETGQQVAPGTVLAQVAVPGRAQVEAYLRPAALGKATPGREVTVRLPDGRSVLARVREQPSRVRQLPAGFAAAATDSRDPMLLVTLDLAEPLPVALAIQGLPVEVRFPRF